jgi:uncharacterized heparinase superfamily protein
MGVSERLRIAMLAADRSRRAALSRLLYAPPLRWRYGSPLANQLIIVPQDLRTSDPSFWHEVQLGQFGLAGTIAVLNGRSPFELKPPNSAWARALHGFGWLRHLDAAGHDEARDLARRLTVEWTVRQRFGSGVAWEPAVAGRRLIAWLSHAALLLDGADPHTYDAITQSLGAQIVRLGASWRDGPEGHPRLLALIALVLADLSVAGHDRQLHDAERAFTQELSRQILPDGGHISRNPAVLIELMLDLLPLRQCFVSRERQPPEALLSAMSHMLAMLRFMRMGDTLLARFNGVSVATPASLATVLAYDERREALSGLAPSTHYARLEQAGAIVVMDAGPPPPLEASGEAQAGCLSFEMSAGASLIFANGGFPAPADADWRAAARATVSHNTLCLGEASSARLVRDRRLESLLGTDALKGPGTVSAKFTETGLGKEIAATHDGYRERFGLMHTRRLLLEPSGRLFGIDRIEGPRIKVRLRQDLPFSIHFHLHPDATCRAIDGEGKIDITLKDGSVWRFSLGGAAVSIEESTFFADSTGPVGALQIVARGATFGETEVWWAVEPVAKVPV